MMKLFLKLLIVAVMTAVPASTIASDFDQDLAERLGADDYGMRQYVLVLLKTGSANELSGDEVAELQRGHMETINRLADKATYCLQGLSCERQK